MIEPLALKKPLTDDALVAWIDCFLDFKVHTCIRCIKPAHLTDEEAEDQGLPHTCQKSYIAGCFFQRHESSLFVGARSAGKSESIAIGVFLNAIFKPGCEQVVSAFTEKQTLEVSTKLNMYIASYWKNAGYNDLKELATVLKFSVEFSNGSKVEFRTGSGRASIKSLHPEILWIDECDLFKESEMSSMENSLTAREYGTQVNFISTSYTMSEGSVVLSKVEAFKEYNLSKPDHMKPNIIYKICLLDILETCDSRYKCFNEDTQKHCMLWSFCKGRAKDIAGGYYPIGEAIKKISTSKSKRSFDAEMLLQTPQAENAYFPTFDFRHIMDPGKLYDPKLETYIGFDFGGIRCHHAAVLSQRDTAGVWYIIDEFQSLGNFENLIKTIKNKYPGIQNYSRCFIDPAGNKKDAMAGAKSYKDLLVDAGWAPRSTSNCKRQDSFDLILGLIEPADQSHKFNINKTCKALIKQLQQAAVKADGKPVDGVGDDLLDCLRYIVFWVLKQTPQINKKWKY